MTRSPTFTILAAAAVLVSACAPAARSLPGGLPDVAALAGYDPDCVRLAIQAHEDPGALTAEERNRLLACYERGHRDDGRPTHDGRRIARSSP